MKQHLIRVLIGFLLCFLPGCSSPFEPEVAEYPDPEGEILKELAANGIPSLAAWVVKDSAIVWEKYYGYADVGNQRPADSNTIYGLASVSKLVVVTAVMQLQEKGLIDLDADISDYLPFAVRNPHYPDEKITGYHLLTHTSGLGWPVDDSEVPGYYRHYPLDAAPPLGEWLPEFILPEGRHYVSAVWKNSRPGEREGYSNIGVALLAYLVETVSNMDYSEYCKQHIFRPLEMFNTSHDYADLDVNHLATLYDHPQRPLEFYRYRDYPSGDLKTTIEDFSHFMIAYLQGGQYKNTRILEESTIQEILEIQNPASGLCLIWGYSIGGWYGHSGGKPGIAAYVEFQPDRHLALMMVANYRHSTVYPGNKTHALLRRIVRQYN